MTHSPDWVAVVGAPRCGTTSLASWMSGHPAVSHSAVKEPHFFSQHDLSGLATADLRELVQERYLGRYFADARAGTVLAEGSVSYLYTPEQMEPILRLWPQARFVIALRDPLELLRSLHQRLLYIGDESVEDFATAWSLSSSRARGKMIPRSCVDPRFLRYDEAGRLGHYVGRFFEAVGRERCHVVLFDDLRANPMRVYLEVLSFLNLPYDGRTDFGPRRQGTAFRHGWLQRLLKRPPILTRGILASEKDRIRRGGNVPRRGTARILALRKRLLRWNRVEVAPQPLSADLRKEIRAALQEDVRLLSKLIDRDLRHWLHQEPTFSPPQGNFRRRSGFLPILPR